MKRNYKIIFHIDLNAFFASCEIAKNPKLRDKPIGISGRSTDRGVITTANYIARKYGVSSAMPVSKAKRLCKNLLLIEGDYQLYSDYSSKFFDFLFEYTESIEPASIDEGYLDVTDLCQNKHPLDLAKEMQERLLRELELPCSIGIAPNMFLAKMASNMKKPLGITVLRKRDVGKYLWPLHIKKMHGIGKKTYPKLENIGISTIGDLANYKDDFKLKQVLGNGVQDFKDKANGINNRLLNTERFDKIQSVGNSKTFDKDIYDYNLAINELSNLSRKVVNRLVDKNILGKTISIQIKNNDFTQISRSYTKNEYTNNFYTIYEIAEDLFDKNYLEKPIRLLGVSVSNLLKKQDHNEQLNLFNVHQEATQDEKVIRLINALSNKYGENIITRGMKDIQIDTNKYKK